MLARIAQGDTCRVAVGIASASHLHTCIYYAYSYIMGAHIFFGEAGCGRHWVRIYFAYVVAHWIRIYVAYAGGRWVCSERLGVLGEAGCLRVACRL